MSEQLPRGESPTPSVDKALRILQVLADHPRGRGLGEIAGELGLPKASLHRTLAALRYRGFVTQAPGSRHYRLGPEVLRIGFALYRDLDLRALAHPVLEELSVAFGETAHLGVREGSEVVYQDKVDPDRSIRMASTIGGRNPAHCTALGKAILAYDFAGDGEAVQAIRTGRIRLSAKTPNTLTRPEDLLRELEGVRRRGYAVDREENELGVRCVGIPLVMGGRPVGAISLSGPAHRLSDEVVEDLVPRAAQMIADRLGDDYLPDALRTLVDQGAAALP
jgi:DNA-binding IclR family transcriptional regulator